MQIIVFNISTTNSHESPQISSKFKCDAHSSVYYYWYPIYNLQIITVKKLASKITKRSLTRIDLSTAPQPNRLTLLSAETGVFDNAKPIATVYI